jgi:hypothetical protein
MLTADRSTAARRGGRSQTKAFGTSVTRPAAPTSPQSRAPEGQVCGLNLLKLP